MSFIEIADYIGVFVFAVSGGLVAIRSQMDVFGILVISLLPAIGGGTLRDLLLDTPVFWLDQPWVVCVALLGGIAAIVYKSWTKLKLMVWVDALGLARQRGKSREDPGTQARESSPARTTPTPGDC